MGPLSGILTGLHITCLRAVRFLHGEKRHTAMAASPASGAPVTEAYESAPRSRLPADRVPSPPGTAACSQLLLRLERPLLCSLYEKAILSFQHLEIFSLLYLCPLLPWSPESFVTAASSLANGSRPPAPFELGNLRSQCSLPLRRQHDDGHAHKAGFQYLLLGLPQH